MTTPTILHLNGMAGTAAPIPDRASGPPEGPQRLTEAITGRLSHGLTNIRMKPQYVRRQSKSSDSCGDRPLVGPQAEEGQGGVQGRSPRVPAATCY